MTNVVRSGGHHETQKTSRIKMHFWYLLVGIQQFSQQFSNVSLALIQHLKKWLTSPDMALRVRKLLKDCLEQVWGLLRFQT